MTSVPGGEAAVAVRNAHGAAAAPAIAADPCNRVRRLGRQWLTLLSDMVVPPVCDTDWFKAVQLFSAERIVLWVRREDAAEVVHELAVDDDIGGAIVDHSDDTGVLDQ